MSPTGLSAPIVVALVGYGYWGPNLMRNYMELPGATVKWVCDARPQALQKAQTRYPSVAVTAELAEVLADAAAPPFLSPRPSARTFPSPRPRSRLASTSSSRSR